jgi:hypothetical protein
MCESQGLGEIPRKHMRYPTTTHHQDRTGSNSLLSLRIMDSTWYIFPSPFQLLFLVCEL